jgi:TRAP-type C4-dicarboxylate transport system permease small subunit
MQLFNTALRRVIEVGTILAAISLLVVMCLVVASVTARFFGRAIGGSYEMIQLIISVTISFSLAYTALKGGHVAVEVVSSRLPARFRQVATVVVSALALGFWGVMAYAGFDFILDKGMSERTETIKFPLFPFRVLLAFGLLLLALDYISVTVKALHGETPPHDVVEE